MDASSEAFTRVTARVRDAETAERAAAEAYAVGAAGLEERESSEGVMLIVYAPASEIEAVSRALVASGARVSPVEGVALADWSEAWKQHLEPVVVSARLVVRPTFLSFDRAPGQSELCIDPGQAFGTGAHESTRLALEWVDALAPQLGHGTSVLDVGAGSGILTLAALRLSGAIGVGLDLDPLAAQAARAAALGNGLDARARFFTGPIGALSPGLEFDLVLANLLRSEMEPLLADLASRTRRWLVLSGLLAAERAHMEQRAAGRGLEPVDVRERVDASGACWVSLLMRPRRRPARS
jgi:ribosomal protein L11 methyltransferase